MDSRKQLSLLLVAVLVLFAAPCFGLVSGTVTDTDGKAVSGASVTFTDESNPARSMSSVTDVNGKYQIDIATSVNDAFGATAKPEPFILGQNYPNPFNPSTTIPFVINKAGNVKIEIFSVTGQHIRTLINEYRSPGIQSVLWDALDDKGAHVSAGVYLYRLQANDRSESKKMMLLDGGLGAGSTGGSSASLPAMGNSAKTSSTTWSLEIKADGIITYTESHMILIEGNTYDFVVIRLPAITFVSIPGGTFQMGDEVGDLGSVDRPVHTGTVSSFEMSESEITNAQYCVWLNEVLGRGEVTVSGTSVMGAKGTWAGNEYMDLNYSVGSSNNCWIKYGGNVFSVETGKENWPVVYVTWYGAKAFSEGYEWDLPHEVEWEYACRGGKQSLFGTDDGTISFTMANYWDSGLQHPVDVKSYPPSSFGLFDMSGNVWEWCADLFELYNQPGLSGTDRIMRGGGWYDSDRNCRSAHRSWFPPEYGLNNTGFRVVYRAPQ